MDRWRQKLERAARAARTRGMYLGTLAGTVTDAEAVADKVALDSQGVMQRRCRNGHSANVGSGTQWGGGERSCGQEGEDGGGDGLANEQARHRAALEGQPSRCGRMRNGARGCSIFFIFI